MTKSIVSFLTFALTTLAIGCVDPIAAPPTEADGSVADAGTDSGLPCYDTRTGEWTGLCPLPDCYDRITGQSTGKCDGGVPDSGTPGERVVFEVKVTRKSPLATGASTPFLVRPGTIDPLITTGRPNDQQPCVVSNDRLTITCTVLEQDRIEVGTLTDLRFPSSDLHALQDIAGCPLQAEIASITVNGRNVPNGQGFSPCRFSL